MKTYYLFDIGSLVVSCWVHDMFDNNCDKLTLTNDMRKYDDVNEYIKDAKKFAKLICDISDKELDIEYVMTFILNEATRIVHD